MNNNDAYKINGILNQIKRCKENFEKYKNEKDYYFQNILEKSQKQFLFDEWAVSLYNLVNDIEKSKDLFDEKLYLEMNNYYNSKIIIDDKYKYLIDEINWTKYSKKFRNKVSLRLLLESFRSKETHSIKDDKKEEYLLFSLSVNEKILFTLFNLCIKLVNDKMNQISLEDKKNIVRNNNNVIINFYKLQNQFCSNEFKELINSLDEKKFKEQKEMFNNFLNFKVTKDNIKIIDGKED